MSSPRKRKLESEPIESSSVSQMPARTARAREDQLIALAMDAAEKHLREGTATSQEIVHFLKLGSSRERLEQEAQQEDINLKRAKTEALQSTKRVEELYTNALDAMRMYSGMPIAPTQEDYDE